VQPHITLGLSLEVDSLPKLDMRPRRLSEGPEDEGT
jgi:hypothetical protein